MSKKARIDNGGDTIEILKSNPRENPSIPYLGKVNLLRIFDTIFTVAYGDQGARTFSPTETNADS